MSSLFYYKKNDEILKARDFLVVLPHLDDEFAIAPLLKLLVEKKINIKVIFCAERFKTNHKNREKRRKESFASMALLGIETSNIFFLNDYFCVEDCLLYKSANKIYKFLEKINKEYFFKNIITLTLEGGHPDHDSLSLLIFKYCQNNGILPYFFPAYNYQKTFFIPYSILKPLKSEKENYKYIKLPKYFWIYSLKICLIYRTEMITFLRIIPFIILKTFFSKKIYYLNSINYKNINWENSLTTKRYKVKFEDILNKLFLN